MSMERKEAVAKLNGQRRVNDVIYSFDNNIWHNHVCFRSAITEKVAYLKINKTNKNQYCPFTNKQISQYIQLINRYIGGIESHTINKTEIIIKYNSDKLKLEDNKSSRLLVFTFLRFLFEYDFNTMLYISFMMKKKYPKYRLIDYLLWMHCRSVLPNYYNSNHSLFYPNSQDDFRIFDINKIPKNITSVYNTFSEIKSITNKSKINEIKQLFKNENISDWKR